MMKCAVTIGLGLGLMIGAPAEAARNPCEATVAERLERLNVDPSYIRKIDYVAFPPKPPGMWWSTYERLSAEADEAHTVASAGLQKILDDAKRPFS